MLQERLVIESIVVTLVAAGYFPGFYVTWVGHPGLDQAKVLAHILSPWTFVLLGVHLLPWLICRWRPLPGLWLRAIDLAHCAAVGIVFGRVILTHPAPPIAPVEAVLASTAVLGVRALIIPSTGRRTLAAGVLLCAGPAITIFSNAEHFTASWMGVRTSGPMFLTWATIGVVLTAVASMVLYGLRRQVQNAERLGQYTLVERLGEGGMGVVYRAQHALLRRPTAVKLIRSDQKSESAARFEREVQLMAELTHPNTVAVFDYGRTDDGVFYYAMEYLEGIDLEDLVTVGGPQEPRRVIHILRQVCGSLAEAHQRGLVHRDVKPANLFLCKNRSEPDLVKVLDFGLVKDAETNEPALSATNTVLGTPLYMAPEAIVGAGQVDSRSDLYSLGAVAYTLLTGTPVFNGPTALEVCAQHLHAPPEAPSARLGRALPADLEALVLSCLAKAPEARPKSALELRGALDACEAAGDWTANDAVAWWTAHDARIGARRSGVHVSGTAATITVGKSRANDPTQDLRARA
jgi:serine/threonine-protein kinase